MKRTIWWRILYIVSVNVPFTNAWEQCGDFYCPTGNTCCLNAGCIPSDMGIYNGTCCNDDHDDNGKTGCPVGYACIQQSSYGESIHDQFPISNVRGLLRSTNHLHNGSKNYQKKTVRGLTTADDSSADQCVANEKYAPMADEFVKVLPRYHLCQVFPPMNQIHGFPMDDTTKLGYYSSYGDVIQSGRNKKNNNNDDDDSQSLQSSHHTSNIEMIWIVIHGSGRNADDYFCSALAAVEIQTQWKDVWVIVPRFFEKSDEPPKDFLFWETNPEDGDGTWRYGANSVNGGGSSSSSSTNGISSYAALDKLIEHLWMTSELPNLNQIVVSGHSSGGQFVHRWSLLTPIWTDDYKNKMKAIVANPSSYIYLTPKRWMKDSQTWDVPSELTLRDCPNYNKYEWGLDDGGILTVPYRDAIFKSKSKDDVIETFRQRRIIYLSGSLDRCPGEKMMDCHSHGIETTCMDELQGQTRFERSLLYFASLSQCSSLSEYGGEWEKHERVVVDGVGHDHSLMWTSEAGIESIFSDINIRTTAQAFHLEQTT